ncbi:MAG TPA: TonB-dependent receptor, partial [Steroidobacteraceae bacterium]|nr:TonB-dependent receptor [Steroidobacteraceae bacterium]
MRSLRGVMRAILGCAAVSLACGGTAVAQDQDSERGRTLDEVLVTAQKREQNVQDVPIVVTAVSGQLLQDSGVHDIKDLTLLVPGLIVTSTSNETSTTARIRGMGTVGDNIGLESSVGVVIDEVYRPRNGVGFGDLGELERIEVLKGPQGTLFGKNTSAGVINVKTKAPSFDVDADVALSAGNYGLLEQSFALTGPIAGDKLAGRIFLAHREYDGLLDVGTGIGGRGDTTDMDREVNTVRGQLLWRPGDNFEARLIADWSERNESCCLGVQYVTGPTGPIVAALSGGAIAVPADPFERRAYANRDTIQDIRDHGASLQMDWDLAGGATVTSVTAWRNWETENGQDSDFSGAGILFRDSKNYSNTFETLTQELRIAGQNGRLTWLAGAFYADEDLESINALNYDSQFEPYVSLLLTQGASTALLSPLLGRAPGTSYTLGFGSYDTYAQSSKSWALFTNNSLAITDQLELTLGLRYTDEEKKLTSNYDNIGDGVGCAAVRARAPILPLILAGAGIPAASHAAIIAGLGSLGCANFSDPLYNDFSHSQKISEGEWSGTAKLAYRFTDDAMGYASYARGYKASGFNLDRER